MDLLLALAVWTAGAWVAYRCARARPCDATGAQRSSGDDERPRRRQEGMDVRRRRDRV